MKITVFPIVVSSNIYLSHARYLFINIFYESLDCVAKNFQQATAYIFKQKEGRCNKLASLTADATNEEFD